MDRNSGMWSTESARYVGDGIGGLVVLTDVAHCGHERGDQLLALPIAEIDWVRRRVHVTIASHYAPEIGVTVH